MFETFWVLRSKFLKFLVPILKRQVNFFSNFASFFLVMTRNSSVNFKLIIIYFGYEDLIKVPLLKTVEYSAKNLPNLSRHFLNHKSVFFQILYHSSVSWDINPLHFLRWNFIYLQQKEPIKTQIWWNFT